MGFAPSAKDEHLIRVIVPNGQLADELQENNRIPPHVAYIVFDMADHVGVADNRQPDDKIEAGGRTFGVVRITNEYLTIDGTFARRPLTYDPNVFMPSEAKRGDLFSYCGAYEGNPVQLDPRVLRWNPDRQRVAMRMNLRYGSFAPVRDSFDPQSDLRDVVRLDLRCTFLAHVAALQLEPTGEVARLTFHSKKFPSGTKLRSLKLARKRTDGDLAVLVGNEPAEDLKASVAFLEPSASGSHAEGAHQQGVAEPPHVLLVQRLLTPGLLAGLFIPRQITSSECPEGDGYVSQVVYKGPIGKSPTCIPIGFGFADPGSQETCSAEGDGGPRK